MTSNHSNQKIAEAAVRALIETGHLPDCSAVGGGPDPYFINNSVCAVESAIAGLLPAASPALVLRPVAPTEDGWYWVKFPRSNHATAFHIRMDFGLLGAPGFWDKGFRTVEEAIKNGGMFAGPIPPPLDPLPADAATAEGRVGA